MLRTRLFLRARILHDDGTVLKPKEKVGFVNLALQSLWNQVDISVQQQVISPTVSTNYAYKAYFDVLFKYGVPSNTVPRLQSQLFNPDTLGFMNDSDALSGGNFGLFQRAKMTEDSAFVDICQQDRFLINGVQVAIKLWPNRDAFCLMSEDGMKSGSFTSSLAAFVP